MQTDNITIMNLTNVINASHIHVCFNFRSDPELTLCERGGPYYLVIHLMDLITTDSYIPTKSTPLTKRDIAIILSLVYRDNCFSLQ